jgi:hypothetical protein
MRLRVACLHCRTAYLFIGVLCLLLLRGGLLGGGLSLAGTLVQLQGAPLTQPHYGPDPVPQTGAGSDSDNEQPDNPDQPDATPAAGPGPEQQPENPPPVNSVGIKPPPLPGDKATVQLPSPAEDVCVGGGGRFLILYLPEQRNLAIFDANEARIVKYLSLAEDNVKVAAGRDHLFVVLPTANVIQRYNLATFEKEVTVPAPTSGQVSHVLLGSASQGPLLLAGGDGKVVFLDPRTFKPQDVKTSGLSGFGPDAFCRVSGDGRVFTTYKPKVSPQGHLIHELVGKIVKSYGLDDAGTSISGHATPSPDGRYVYTAHGAFTGTGKPLGKPATDGKAYALPAAEGETFYLTVEIAGFPHGDPNQASKLNLHLAGDARPLAPLRQVELPRRINGWDREPLGTDQRVQLIPSAKLLVVLPRSNDRLDLYRVDADQLLDKADRDYLLVPSSPPLETAKGATFTYAPVVKSRKGGVKVKLESGPGGMRLTPEGTLTWDVPRDFADPDIDVILTVSDASGQEIFHSFKAAVRDKVEAGPQPPDKPPGDKPASDKPPPAVGPIKPAPLQGAQEERGLPGPLGDVCVGGGGRFLILHLPRDRMLAVFDANEARVVKYLPAEYDAKIAAGLDKLLVGLPATDMLQRWSLSTFEKEATGPSPVPGTVKQFVMGSASRGPLFLGVGGQPMQGGGLVAVDPLTFKDVGFKTEDDRGPRLGFDQYPSELRVSADGRLITAWTPALSPSGRTTLLRQGDTWKGHHEHGSFGDLLPSPDGRLVLASGWMFTAEGKVVREGPRRPAPWVRYVPALHGPFFVSLNQTKQGDQHSLSVGIHVGSDERPLVTLPNLDAFQGLVDWRVGGGLPFDRHVFLIPDARLLVVIPRAKDKLLLCRFDLEQLLDKAGGDYLFVQSQPVTTAVRGQTYTYQVDVKSRKGNLKIKLDSGPEGMKVSPEGQVTWAVAGNFPAAEVDVVLTVSDASGQEIPHKFKISLRDRPEP